MSTSADNALPEQFSELSRFVADWGDLETQSERYLKRQSTPFKRLNDFYAAMAPRLSEIFAHLDSFAYPNLPEPETRLFRLTLGLAEAAQAVEVFGTSRVPYAPVPHHVEARVLPATAAISSGNEVRS